jgi:hypothetical protein
LRQLTVKCGVLIVVIVAIVVIVVIVVPDVLVGQMRTFCNWNLVFGEYLFALLQFMVWYIHWLWWLLIARLVGWNLETV